MGKRSNFERRERDFYATPKEAVEPLVRFLPKRIWTYAEPCAGDGALIRALAELWPWGTCVRASDIEPHADFIAKADALDLQTHAHTIITNPPWRRDLLHPMIEHFSKIAPTWLLFDADWAHTKQAIPFLPHLRQIVSVGRVRWISDSKHTGKDNVAWYRFDIRDEGQTEFYGRT